MWKVFRGSKAERKERWVIFSCKFNSILLNTEWQDNIIYKPTVPDELNSI